MKPLGRLSADSDSEDDVSEPPEDDSESEPPSPYAQNVIKNLQSMYQTLYSIKDTNDFIDGWQGIAEIKAAMDKAT